MKSILVLLLSLVFFPVLALADLPVEGGSGQSGDFLQCEPSSENPFSGLVSLDYVATFKKSNGNKDIVVPNTTQESLKRIANLLKTKAPGLYPDFQDFVDNIRNENDYTKSRVWEEAAFGLVPLNDVSLLSLVPKNCLDGNGKANIIQAVIRKNHETPVSGPIIYKFIPEIFDKVEVEAPLQTSFILIHEWLWDLSLDVDRNRQVIRFLHSERADELDATQFQAQLKGMGIDPGGVGPTPHPMSSEPVWAGNMERFCVSSRLGADCWGMGYMNDLSAMDKKLTKETEGLTQIAMGHQHTCVLGSGGIECYQTNYNPISEIVTIPQLTGVKRLVTGEYHTCALHDEGVACWGDYTPSQVPKTLKNVVDIGARGDQTCALQSGRTVKDIVCWGQKWEKEKTVQPKYFSQATPVDSFSVGEKHVCALSGGRVDCWGENNHGETIAPKLTGIVAISAMRDTTCAISSTNLFCWGDFEWNGPRPKFKNPKAFLGLAYEFCVWDEYGIGCWDTRGTDHTSEVPEIFRRIAP